MLSCGEFRGTYVLVLVKGGHGTGMKLDVRSGFVFGGLDLLPVII
jgi:hypothetical protein